MEVALVWVLLSFPLPHHHCSSAQGILLEFFFLPHILLPRWHVFILSASPLLFFDSLPAPGQKRWQKWMRFLPHVFSSSSLFAAHADLVSFKMVLDHRSLVPILLCIARHKSFGLPLCGKSSFSSIGLADLVAFQIDKHKQHLSGQQKGGLNQRVPVLSLQCLHLPWDKSIGVTSTVAGHLTNHHRQRVLCCSLLAFL